MCEKNGQVYASGSDQNNEKIEFFIDNRWHYNSIYDNPQVFMVRDRVKFYLEVYKTDKEPFA